MSVLIKRLIIIIFTLFISITSLILFTGRENSPKVKPVESNLTFKEKISNVSLDEAFQKSYYLNDNSALFSSTPFLGKPNLYLIEWNLKLASLFNLKELTISDSVSSFLIDRLSNTNDLYEKSSLINTFSSMNKKDVVHKDKLLEFIMSRYSNDESLFFFKDANESLEEKLTATFLSLQMIKVMNLKFKYIDETTEKLKSLVQTEDLFSNDVNVFLNTSSVLISTLNILEVKHQDIMIEQEQREVISEWVNYWNDVSLDITEPSIIPLLFLRNLKNVNDFFDYENTNIKVAISRFHEKDFLYEQDSYVIEPQFIYLMIYLSEEVNASFPLSKYKEKLVNYVESSFNTEFMKISNPEVDVTDLYYGLLIALENNNDFDKEKILKTLDKSLETDNKKMLSDREINNLYYTLRCYELLSQKIEVDNSLVQNINNFISTQLEIKHTDTELLYLIDKILYTTENLDIKIDYDNLKIIETIVDNISKKEETYDTIECTQIYFIYLKLKKTLPNSIHQKIDSSLRNLESDGGFKYKNSSEFSSDVLPTYLAIEYLKASKKLLPQTKSNLVKFLSTPADKVPNNTPDLRSIYQGYQLLEIIQSK